MNEKDTSKNPLPEHLRPKHSNPPVSKPKSPRAKSGNSSQTPAKKVSQTVSPGVAVDEEDLEESQLQKLSRTGMRNMPPALVSFVFHLILIIIIALIYVPSKGQGRFSLFMDTSSIEDDFDQEFELSNDTEFTPTVSAEEMVLSTSESAEAFEPELVKIESTAPAPINPSNNPSFALSGRGENSRMGMLKRFGATPQTENAVELGLKWLAKNQKRNGSWSLKGPYKSLVAEENTMAATGMALLAFLGHGETHEKGKYKTVVAKGIEYLVKNQSGNGHFVERGASLSHSMYSHAMCSIAICELLALTQDEGLAGPAREAIAFAVKAQGAQGGWKYEVGSPRSDLSVTGWFVMLFQSAKYAGVDYDPSVMARAQKFIDSVMTPSGSEFRYEADHEPSLAMSAEGLLCQQYLGWKKDDSRLEAGSRRMLNNPIRWSQKNVYYWYYATQVMRNMDEETWKKWNEKLSTILPEKQRKSGVEAGSWDHTGDPYGGPGGRLYVTCLCLFSLEVYYRHLPIYQMRK